MVPGVPRMCCRTTGSPLSATAAAMAGSFVRPEMSLIRSAPAAAGADLINDISGLTYDPAMAAAVAESGLPVVLQHIRGTPGTMQKNPRYTHLMPEIRSGERRVGEECRS